MKDETPSEGQDNYAAMMNLIEKFGIRENTGSGVFNPLPGWSMHVEFKGYGQWTQYGSSPMDVCRRVLKDLHAKHIIFH